MQGPVAWRQMQEIGDQAVAKQRDGLVALEGGPREHELVGLRHRSSLLARVSASERDPQPGEGSGSAPIRCWRREGRAERTGT
jgi:hypothetical protein